MAPDNLVDAILHNFVVMFQIKLSPHIVVSDITSCISHSLIFNYLIPMYSLCVDKNG